MSCEIIKNLFKVHENNAILNYVDEKKKQIYRGFFRCQLENTHRNAARTRGAEESLRLESMLKLFRYY